MKRSTALLTGLFGLLLLATPAQANDYLSTDTADWFKYDGGQTESRALNTQGNWQLWSNFAGLGDTWIYTWNNSNWWAVWNGQNYQIMPALDQQGLVRTVTLENWGQTRVTVADVGGSLTTPAGTFNDVTRVDLRISNVADAGTTSIWLARGVGVVKWAEQSFAGPVQHELSQAFVGGQMLPASTPTQPTNPTQPGRMRAPTEHAQMESILWGCADTYLVYDMYRDAWTGMHGSGARVECAVDSDQVAAQLRYDLVQDNVPLDEVDFYVVALDTLWMRDYGPIILKDSVTGQREVADLNYFPGRDRDDRFPRAYAQLRGWDRVAVNLDYEGGNFMTDGHGQGMASRGVLMFNQDKSQTTVERRFRQLGCDRVEYFRSLIDEGTTHIDMFARIMGDHDALVSRYPANHRQAAVVDEAAQRLQNLGYHVTRVDADYTYDEYATYSNSTLVNGVALVPQYQSTTKNRAALQAYRDLGYRAVPVESKLIIRYGGATHCSSMQVPDGN